MRARIFSIMQYETHPETGQPLLDRDSIVAALSHKSCKKWAFVCHDKDVYSEADEEANPLHVAGNVKPRHWHIVIQCDNAVDTLTMAKWFGIAENYIDVPKGAGAFLDCVEYLTHEDARQQQMGKILYADDEIESNFAWRDALLTRAANKARYGKDLNDKDQMRQNVLTQGWSLRQCRETNSIGYANDIATLQRLRADYLRQQSPPSTRINFYTCGSGGIGKGLLSRALAVSLFPQIENPEDVYFEVGPAGAVFDGYDGQPVIVWNDYRAYDLLKALGGRGNVFNVFDTHPTKQQQNVKYSTANLVNAVNIVNSVQEYSEFLDGLAGEYKDANGNTVGSEMSEKGQSYRRFPFIIPLHNDFLEILINKGFVEDSREFTTYVMYKRIIGNIAEVAQACGNNKGLADKINAKLVKPIVDKYHDLRTSKSYDMDAAQEARILERFECYGTEALMLDLSKSKKED